jgi:hypothetical protein
MARQRQPKDADYKRLMINVPIDLHEFVKVASHGERLSMSAYLVKLIQEEKNRVLGQKKSSEG